MRKEKKRKEWEGKRYVEIVLRIRENVEGGRARGDLFLIVVMMSKSHPNTTLEGPINCILPKIVNGLIKREGVSSVCYLSTCCFLSFSPSFKIG